MADMDMNMEHVGLEQSDRLNLSQPQSEWLGER